MSGTIKANVQMGDSVTAANNFVITAEANDGTMKLARGNKGATTQDILTVDAAGKVVFPQGSVGGLTLATAQATTSGVSKDFTGIPSWAKRITVLFNATSHNGAGFTYVQIGTGGTPTVSGYICCASQLGASAIASTNDSTAFIFYDNSAASALCGSIQLDLVSGNTWVANGLCASGTASASYTTAGNVTLSGTLDMLRVGVNSGNIFDGGSVNIMYEG